MLKLVSDEGSLLTAACFRQRSISTYVRFFQSFKSASAIVVWAFSLEIDGRPTNCAVYALGSMDQLQLHAKFTSIVVVVMYWCCTIHLLSAT